MVILRKKSTKKFSALGIASDLGNIGQTIGNAVKPVTNIASTVGNVAMTPIKAMGKGLSAVSDFVS